MLPTTNICDKYFDNVRIVKPIFRDFGGRVTFFGKVVTLKTYDDNTKVRTTLERDGTGKILVVDGQGSNSWETIRRWVRQWGIKDDPTSPFTKLHIPDDATEAHRRLQEYVNDKSHENPVSNFEK